MPPPHPLLPWDSFSRLSMMHHYQRSGGIYSSFAPAFVDDLFDPSIETFHHRPLDLYSNNIRTVRILACPGVLRCEIQTVPLSITHTAVSYMWGQPDEPHSPHSIMLNGCRFQVRQNLYEFLSQMRQLGRVDEFWIDALCIDQKNIAERNHQVQQMADIYCRAKEVLLWLGPSDMYKAPFLHLLSLSETLTAGAKSQVLKQAAESVLEQLNQQVSQRRQTFWRCAERLANDDYWTRTWIVQEVLLTQHKSTLVCGSSFLRWTAFSAFVSQAAQSPENDSPSLIPAEDEPSVTVLQYPGEVLRHHHDIPRPKSPEWTDRKRSEMMQTSHAFAFCTRNPKLEVAPPGSQLHDLLKRFGATKCLDPRDRIYALRMLFGHQLEFDVDYGASKLLLLVRLLVTFEAHHNPELVPLLQTILDLGSKAVDFGNISDGQITSYRVDLYRYARLVRQSGATIGSSTYEVNLEESYLSSQFVAAQPPRIQFCHCTHCQAKLIFSDIPCIAPETLSLYEVTTTSMLLYRFNGASNVYVLFGMNASEELLPPSFVQLAPLKDVSNGVLQQLQFDSDGHELSTESEMQLPNQEDNVIKVIFNPKGLIYIRDMLEKERNGEAVPAHETLQTKYFLPEAGTSPDSLPFPELFLGV